MPESERVGVLGLLAVAPVVVLATLSLSMRVTMMFGLGLRSATFVGIAAVFVLAIVSFGFSGLRLLVPSRPSATEVLVLIGILAILVVLWDRAADRSLIWPHLFGADPAHHAALITYIADTGHLLEADARLQGLGNYPVGSHLIAAAITTMTGRAPIVAMWWTGLGAAVSQVFGIAWLTRTCSPGRSWGGIGVALMLWFGAWYFGLGALTISFFFSQILAVSYCVVGVGLVALGGCGLVTRRWVPPVLVLTAATALTYPQHAVVLPAAVAVPIALTLFSRLRAHSWRRRVALVGLTSVVVFAGLALSFDWLALSPYPTRQAIFGVGEGFLPPFTVASMGGTLGVLMLAFGAIHLVTRSVRADRVALVLLAAAAAPAALFVGLTVLRLRGEPVTTYRATKNVYVLLPLLVAASGAAIVGSTRLVALKWLEHRPGSAVGPKRPESFVAVAAVLLSLGIVLRPNPLRTAWEPLVDRDAYVLSQAVVKRFPRGDVGVVSEGISAYVLWFVFFRENALTPSDPISPPMTAWNNWPDGPRDERYLLVDAESAGRYSTKPGVRVIGRHNGALLLERPNITNQPT